MKVLNVYSPYKSNMTVPRGFMWNNTENRLDRNIEHDTEFVLKSDYDELLNCLNYANEELTESRSENSELQRKLKHLQAEALRTVNVIRDMEACYEDDKQAANELELAIGESNIDAGVLVKSRLELIDDINAISQRVESIDRQRAAVQVDRDTIQSKLQQLQTNIHHANRENDGLKKQIAELEVALLDANREAGMLNSKNYQLTTENNELKVELTEIKKLGKQVAGKNVELGTENNQLKVVLENTKKGVDANPLAALLADAIKINQKLRDELEKAHQDADFWHRQNAQLYKQIDQASGEKILSQVESSAKECAIHFLREENAALRTATGGPHADTIKFILKELARAEEKFPEWHEDAVHAAAVLGEEAGELTQAANQFARETVNECGQHLARKKNARRSDTSRRDGH